MRYEQEQQPPTPFDTAAHGGDNRMSRVTTHSGKIGCPIDILARKRDRNPETA